MSDCFELPLCFYLNICFAAALSVLFVGLSNIGYMLRTHLATAQAVLFGIIYRVGESV